MMAFHFPAGRVLSLALLMALPASLSAQSFTWNGGGGIGNWSTGANWGGTGPANGGGTGINLTFGGTVQTATTMDLGTPATPFQLNSLRVNANAASGFSVSGGALRFNGASSRITVTGGTNVRMLVASQVEFATNTIIDITANSTGSSVTRELAFTGKLSGAGNLTVTSAGGSNTGREVAVASTNNSYSGTLTVLFGRVDLLAANALGRDAKVALNGGNLQIYSTGDSGLTLPVNGFSQQLAEISGTSAASRIETGTTLFGSVMFGFNNAATSYAGTYLMNNAGSQMIKVGTGQFDYTGNTVSGLTGRLSVRGGIYNFVGDTTADGGFNVAAGGSIEVFAGAELRQTASGDGDSGRFADAGAITMRGGLLRLEASGLTTSAAGYSDAAGNLVLGAGQSTLRIDTAIGRGAGLSFASLAGNTPTATIFFQSGNLGGSTLATPGSGNVEFRTTPTLVGGATANYTAGAFDMKILPYAFAATSATGTPSTFVSYDTTTGSIRGLADTDYATTIAGATSTQNVRITTADPSPLPNNTTVNSLVIANTLASPQNVGSNFTLTSGALLALGTGNSTIAGGLFLFGPLGSSTAFVTVADPTGTLTLATSITAANFSKNGAGKVSLQNTVSLGANPTVAVNAGTLELLGGNFTATSGTLTYQVSKGATLSTVNFNLGANRFLTGNGTVADGGTTGITIGSGATIRPSALGGSDATLASPGTLTVTGKTTFEAGGIYEFYVSSVVGAPGDSGNTYVRSLITTNTGTADTGTLNITATSANKFNVKVTPLSLSNVSGGGVYDSDGGTYQRTIAHFGGGIGGNNSADSFNVIYNPADFAGANLSLSVTGTDIVLTMTPVPEPACVLGFAVAGLGVARWLRRRTKSSYAGEAWRFLRLARPGVPRTGLS